MIVVFMLAMENRVAERTTMIPKIEWKRPQPCASLFASCATSTFEAFNQKRLYHVLVRCIVHTYVSSVGNVNYLPGRAHKTFIIICIAKYEIWALLANSKKVPLKVLIFAIDLFFTTCKSSGRRPCIAHIFTYHSVKQIMHKKWFNLVLREDLVLYSPRL